MASDDAGSVDEINPCRGSILAEESWWAMMPATLGRADGMYDALDDADGVGTPASSEWQISQNEVSSIDKRTMHSLLLVACL